MENVWILFNQGCIEAIFSSREKYLDYKNSLEKQRGYKREDYSLLIRQVD